MQKGLVSMSVRLSENIELVKEIRNKLKENDGCCPCKIKKTEDTKCMCKEFREQKEGECHCGLFYKSKEG
jgi:ferredoxin-thioredoxin reductase catalytic subunit